MRQSHRRDGERLPDQSTVYRAMRKSGWRNPETGEVSAAAFLRRQYENGEWEAALSVSESPTGAVRNLKKNYGVCPVPVSGLRAASWPDGESLGLDVDASPILAEERREPFHADVTGLPPFLPATDDEAQAAQDAADRLVELLHPIAAPAESFLEPTAV